ncbi:MAG TPA: calcium-binding protein, partial [Solirubrobacteraceae bacterium]|nr:calcium-binding protein [Solirubrobacteraceae bacterium]
MPVTRAARLGIAAVVAAAVLLGPPTAAAAGLPYELTFDGATRLAASPAAGATTLAVKVTQTPAGIEFRPAAAAFPAGCSNTLDVTTCPAGHVATGLVLGAPLLESTVAGLTTPQLVLAGGAESDSMVIDGPGSIAAVALAPGAGADSVTVNAPVGAITLAPGDTGADRYTIASSSLTISGSLALGDGNDVASSLAPNLDIDGGAGDDVLGGAGQLIGGDGSDVLKPRVAAEVAVGGDGIGDVDRLSFELMTTGLELQKTGATDVQAVGHAPIKTGFEELEGTPHDDALRGTAGPDMLLLGGEGNDTVAGHGGGDLLDGGPGADTAGYAWAAGPVTVDLGAETGSAGGPVDALRSFRAVTTGAGNDNLTGASGPESFAMGAGDDVVNAGAGDDTIDGGSGSDVLRGGYGNDLLDGGAGADTATYDERSASEPLSITLASPGGDGGAGESDTLAGVENVVSGASNDTISGDDGANALTGGRGLDVLEGLGGGDVISGGDDRDVIGGGSGSDVLLGEGDD